MFSPPLDNATKLHYYSGMTMLSNTFAALRDVRYRLTKRRRALIIALFQSQTPLPVSDILVRMAKDGVSINKTTAYRELATLERLGSVTRVPMSDRKQYFELSSRDHHHHLVCIGCERVEDILVDESAIVEQEKRAASEYRFRAVQAVPSVEISSVNV